MLFRSAFLIATNDASEYHIGETERQFLQKVFIMLKDVDALITADTAAKLEAAGE